VRGLRYQTWPERGPQPAAGLTQELGRPGRSGGGRHQMPPGSSRPLPSITKEFRTRGCGFLQLMIVAELNWIRLVTIILDPSAKTPSFLIDRPPPHGFDGQGQKKTGEAARETPCLISSGSTVDTADRRSRFGVLHDVEDVPFKIALNDEQIIGSKSCGDISLAGTAYRQGMARDGLRIRSEGVCHLCWCEP